MANVGLPSIALWQGMRSRASALPHLMQDAMRDGSTLNTRRVDVCLQQLAALGSFVQAVRFSLYCRECNKLLRIFEQQDSRRAVLAPLLLCAAVRVAQSLGRPLECLIDRDNLNELRQARGVSAISPASKNYRARWAVPTLKNLLHKHLLQAHYTLAGSAGLDKHSDAAAQQSSIASLNRVAALWLGEALLEQIKQGAHFRPVCLQVLRLEMCSKRVSEGAPPTTFSTMRQLYLALSRQRLLSRLRAQVRALVQQKLQQDTVDLEQSLAAFHRINGCCNLLASAQELALEKFSESALQLALHLRCWKVDECEASVLLSLCVLCLERHLDIAIAMSQERRPCDLVDSRLRRKVLHFIRTHRRRLRVRYCVPVNSVRALAREELQGIHRELRDILTVRERNRFSVDDAFLHALIRFKGIALYMGDLALYEFLLNLRELVVLAIERKLLLPQKLIFSLPRMSAYCLRSFEHGRRKLAYETRVFNKFTESLRVQRQNAFIQLDMSNNSIRMRTPQKQGKHSSKRSIGTRQLPSFLAKNIRGLIAEPVAVYRCQSTQEFAEKSRVLILELTLLARGARALQVDRVAALSEVLLEVYRALITLPVLPEKRVLERNLQVAHRCLRYALNQAAARQMVCDVRPTIVGLYHFLECLHRVPVCSSNSTQVTLSAVNTLVADMRAFGDVFASFASHGRGARYQLAQEQLQGLIATSRRLQEELSKSGMIGIARWGARLQYAVSRYSNERNKPARLELMLGDIEAPRPLVQQLQSLLEHLLCLMIEHSVESCAQRRCAGKPDSAHLRLGAARTGTALIISIEDDGIGLAGKQITEVTEQIAALGGSLLLVEGLVSGSRVSVTIP